MLHVHHLRRAAAEAAFPHATFVPEKLQQDILLEHVNAHGSDVRELGSLVLGDPEDRSVHFLQL